MIDDKLKKELEETARSLSQNLALSPTERRLAGLLGPFLQVLFSGAAEESQTKILKLFYDFQLVKEKTIKDVHSTKSKESAKSE